MDATPTKYKRDLIARLLRKQIKDLSLLLFEIELGSSIGESTDESLKRAERQMLWLKKLCSEN